MMSHNRSGLIKPLVGIAGFTVVIIGVLVLIVSVLINPVAGKTDSYSAIFDDVSGLKVGNDVRMAGVSVGKVESIALDKGAAKVRFEVRENTDLYQTTKAAVRYQNLLGQRYVELVRMSGDPDPVVLKPDSVIDEKNTIPSFDVSKLFNGFKPLFASFDSSVFNTFADNVLRMIQSDGRGADRVLDDLDRLTNFATQREPIIKLLITNLGEISQTISGKSGQVAGVVYQLGEILSRFGNEADNIVSSLDDINNGMTPFVEVLESLQSAYDTSFGPVDAQLTRLVPNKDQIAQILSLTPSLLTGINNSLGARQASATYTCSKGRKDIPGIGQVVLGNQRLVLCR